LWRKRSPSTLKIELSEKPEPIFFMVKIVFLKMIAFMTEKHWFTSYVRAPFLKAAILG
jgi:hypothetical protein